jgi:hypothetical protein
MNWSAMVEDEVDRDGRVVIDKSGICDHCLYDFAKE